MRSVLQYKKITFSSTRVPNLSPITNQNNDNQNLMVYHDELALEVSFRYNTECIEGKKTHDLFCKAHNEYHHELTYIMLSEVTLIALIDLTLFYEIDLNHIVKKISKIKEQNKVTREPCDKKKF